MRRIVALHRRLVVRYDAWLSTLTLAALAAHTLAMGALLVFMVRVLWWIIEHRW